MKILLVSLENTLVCFGIRMISAVLKKDGFDVEILYLPREFNQLETPDDVSEIADWIAERQADLIGFSLMSSHMRRLIPIHTAVKQRCRVPIVWGGIHPTIRPEECIQYAEIVCVGEGEHPMLELAQALRDDRNPSGIPNLWFNRNDEITRNPPRPRTDDLDALPWADHDATNHWVRHENVIRPVDEEVWRCYIPGFMEMLYVMSSRGCPHNCTYCCNSALRGVADGPYLRRRSPKHFVDEMIVLKQQFPNLKGFVFMDDSFFYGSPDWFDDFCRRYKRDIDLPFFCWANPVAVTEERIKPLAAAGLVGVHVGLESGSERISETIYERHVPRDRFFKCMDILHKYRKQIVDIRVDVITDNPYEREEDVAATVETLSYLKKPLFVGIVSLIFYPQTALERRAVADGLIEDGDDELYTREFFHYQPTLLNRMMRSVPVTPGWLIRFFLRHRKTGWGKFLFYLWYFGYFIAVRRRLRGLRRILTLAFLKYFGHRLDPKTVATTRAALIDF